MVFVKNNTGTTATELKQRLKTTGDNLNNKVFKSKDTNLRNDCQNCESEINGGQKKSTVKKENNLQSSEKIINQSLEKDLNVSINFEINIAVVVLFLVAFGFRIYELDKPASIV